MTLHGNPADYAWGVGGLDNIITQVGFNYRCFSWEFDHWKVNDLTVIYVKCLYKSAMFLNTFLIHYLFQLLNQLEGSGPAPAEKSKIDSLPNVKVSQVQVGKTLVKYYQITFFLYIYHYLINLR